MYCVHKCNVALFSRHQTILFPFTETEDLDNYLHHADCRENYLSLPHWHDSAGIRTSNSKATNPSKPICKEIKHLQMNDRRVGCNHIWPVKAMTAQGYCSCLQECYQPVPELQTDMRVEQQTQTGRPTKRGQWSIVGAATPIPSAQKYTLNTASPANASTSRWISNQMIPSPGCSRQSLQHYEADMPRSREWNNRAATFRLPPIQNSTRGRSFHPSQCETKQRRHGQHIQATLFEEKGEVRDHPRSRRNGRCLESDASRRNLIFCRVLHKRF